MLSSLISSLGLKKTAAARNSKKNSLALESLEDRNLMASQLSATLINGTLRIDGTEYADRIIVRERQGVISVDNTPIYVNARSYQAAPVRAIKVIEVNGLGGDDVISLNPRGMAVSRPSRLNGGNGNDLIVGGNSADLIYGGAGNDVLMGYAGNDGLFGGEGKDTLDGGSHTDRFLVRPGDTVRDLTSLDAALQFVDGTRSWTDSEIQKVELGLAKLHARTGTATLLKQFNGQGLTFERMAVVENSAEHLGANNNAGKIQLSDSLFGAHQSEIVSTVIHEISHNWDDTKENGFIRAFRAQSGWSSVNRSGLVAVEGGDWFYRDNTNFVWAYGRVNPYEDFATSFEVALGVNRSETTIDGKLAVIDRFLNAVRQGYLGNRQGINIDLADLKQTAPHTSYSVRRAINSVVTVTNGTANSMTYFLLWPGMNWQQVTIAPGQSRIHSVFGMNKVPMIAYDAYTQSGIQWAQFKLASKPYVSSPDEGWGTGPRYSTDGFIYTFRINSNRTGWTMTTSNALNRTRDMRDRAGVLSAPGFPRLGQNFEVLGTATGNAGIVGYYNCIAWSLGEVNRWVDPITSRGNNVLAGMDQLYAAKGYQRVSGLNFNLVQGYQKVVVYATITNQGNINAVTHAAIQLTDGSWASKLGGLALIRHMSPNDLNGPVYGVPVAVYAKRV